MSNTNGTNSFARSLNGIITYDDGAGSVIQNGTVNTGTLITNNIQASNLTTDCKLWETNSGNILIGSTTATNILKFQTPITECTSQPTTANGVVNKIYADTNISNLLASTNIW